MEGDATTKNKERRMCFSQKRNTNSNNVIPFDLTISAIPSQDGGLQPSSQCTSDAENPCKVNPYTTMALDDTDGVPDHTRITNNLIKTSCPSNFSP